MTERYSEMPQQPERDEAVIRVQGLVNRFGDNVVHEGLDLTSTEAKFSALSAAQVPVNQFYCAVLWA